MHLVNGSDNMHFFYDARNRPAVVVFNGTDYGYIYNVQGDVIALVDSTGAKVVEYYYDAWGKILSITGTLATSLGTLNPFRYRGCVFDEETGLYYLRQRYYKPELGRFISADKDKSAYFKSAYSYCSNNPSNFHDPSGCDEETFSTMKNHLSISKEYYIFLQTIYDYSWKMLEQSELYSAKPSVYTTTKVMKNCENFAERKYPYEKFDCAYSIARQLPYRTTSTGMTSMWDNDAIATISLEDAGGVSNLLQGMVLVCYDAARKNYAHHGGFYVNQTTTYESTPSLGGFRKSEITRQSWNMVMWVDGMILSPTQMKVVESILFLVREEE